MLTGDDRSAGRARAVLFDLDGTVIDSRPGVTMSIAHAIAAVGGPEQSQDDLGRFIGPPTEEVFREIFRFSPNILDKAMASYREHYRNIGIKHSSVFAGMEYILRSLQAMGTTNVLATSRSEEATERLLTRFALDGYFSQICAGTAGHNSKKEVIENALAFLHSRSIPPEDTIMVGDRKYDSQGAALWGMSCIVVSWGYATPEELAHERIVVHSVEQLGVKLGIPQ